MIERPLSAFETDLKPQPGSEDRDGCKTLQYGLFLSCIHRELFKVCPRLQPGKECRQIKKFMKKCPDQGLPPMRDSKFRNGEVPKDILGEAMRQIIEDKTV